MSRSERGSTCGSAEARGGLSCEAPRKSEPGEGGRGRSSPPAGAAGGEGGSAGGEGGIGAGGGGGTTTSGSSEDIMSGTRTFNTVKVRSYDRIFTPEDFRCDFTAFVANI